MEQTNDKGALCQRKLIICRGLQLQGSVKSTWSTWSKAWAKEDLEHRVRFNNDDIYRLRIRRFC